MTMHIFTFGPDHHLPNGEPAKDVFVGVEAPSSVDHRAVFMGWLGSNKFSSEYTFQQFVDSGMYGSYKPAMYITVEPPCPACGASESNCVCLLDDEPGGFDAQ